MTRRTEALQHQVELRTRAVARLTGPSAQPQIRADASTALGVLYELASSPSTAPNALALLHELQVHQVEVDLQDEELRRSRLELETALNRHAQLYDSAPAGYFTVDGDTVVSELNLTGAALLGYEPDYLRGRPLDSFLTPDSARDVKRMLERAVDGAADALADLQFRRQDGTALRAHASARRDPASARFLIALIESSRSQSTSPTCTVGE
jgi:PAS domain S-box-containing protein